MSAPEAVPGEAVPPRSRRPRSIRRVLARSVAVQVAVLALVAMVVAGAVVGYRVLADEVRAAERTLLRLESLRTETLSAETSLRGYALVRRPEFLDPYREAFPRIEEHLDALATTDVADDPRLAETERLILDWRDDFAEPILAALGEGREEEAAARFRTGAGKERIDAVRARTADLEVGVRAGLLDRQGDADRFGVVAIVAAIGSVAIALVLGYALQRRLERRVARPIAELSEVAERLGGGDLGVRASGDGVVETNRMAGAFNVMADSLEKTVTDLRAVDRMKSEFVSVVSHELRTPLTSIRGSLGLLTSGAFGPLPDEASRMVAIAVSNTDRLVRLINDILDLERIDAGTEALEIRPCVAGDLMVEAADGVRSTYNEAEIGLVVHPVNAPLLADADRLHQALTNLLGNAVKFSEPGDQVTLTGAIRPGEVVISVVDEGRGIPAEKLETIFSRFQQVDASDAREKGGTGLGLAIVRSIAEKLGGRVEVESMLGEGSTFSLVLPLAASAPAPTGPAEGGDRPRVLIVEDDHDLAAVLQTLLERNGLEALTAATPEQAIGRCLESAPDLLVLDVQLAEGDGYEVVQRLRAHDHLRSIATVVFTVHDLTPAQQDRLRLGETAFLTKGPNPTEDLEAQVVGLLDRLPVASDR